MSTSLAPIKCPPDFLEKLCAAIKEKYPLNGMEDRHCIIVRCPSNYGQVYSVIIEMQGSPPPFRIYVSGMDYANAPVTLVVLGKAVRNPQRARQANDLIKRFLAAHPENSDGSPVWIEPRKGASHE